ncbi:hypothetical protein OHB06_51070 [Streptomyces sp. NBC_01604]|uniref:hypothetical protein n=1 Tax=Streptomyces sp. NBC_01604 TaxID=2975894 RepID=UPI0038683F66
MLRDTDRLPQLLGVRGQLRVERQELGDQIPGQLLAHGLRRSGRADAPKQSRCLSGRELRGYTAGRQITQQRVQLIGRAYPRLGQVPTPFVEQGQHGGVSL